VEDIQRIVRELREQDNLAILITDHSVRETLSIVDRAFLIHDGRVILQGTSEEIVNNPIARQNYLGENFRF
jgi:lipopolysaccharide export system ATP-binding protein